MNSARAASRLLATVVVGSAWVLTQSCSPPSAAGAVAAGPPVPASEDTTGQVTVPVGFGSLRQDDIAIRLQPTGMIVRAIPLDENVIRLLTPDSYRALRDLEESNHVTIETITRRSGGRRPAAWYVSFYGLQPEARFSPMELVISSAGQDFRPIDVIPLEHRLRRAAAQTARDAKCGLSVSRRDRRRPSAGCDVPGRTRRELGADTATNRAGAGARSCARIWRSRPLRVRISYRNTEN